jgi:hypothetical protein
MGISPVFRDPPESEQNEAAARAPSRDAKIRGAEVPRHGIKSAQSIVLSHIYIMCKYIHMYVYLYVYVYKYIHIITIIVLYIVVLMLFLLSLVLSILL